MNPVINHISALVLTIKSEWLTNLLSVSKCTWCPITTRTINVNEMREKYPPLLSSSPLNSTQHWKCVHFTFKSALISDFMSGSNSSFFYLYLFVHSQNFFKTLATFSTFIRWHWNLNDVFPLTVKTVLISLLDIKEIILLKEDVCKLGSVFWHIKYKFCVRETWITLQKSAKNTPSRQ